MAPPSLRLPLLLILAGGASRRLGRDKRLLDDGGQPLLARTVARVSSLGPVFVQVEPEGAGRLPQLPGAAVLADRTPGRGPLPVVQEALRRLQVPLFVLAADLPRLSTTTMETVRDAWRGRPEAVAVAAHPGGLEPLCAIYPPGAGPWLQAAVREGATSLQRTLAAAPATRVQRVEVAPAEFLNLNAPGDVGHWRSG